MTRLDLTLTFLNPLELKDCTFCAAAEVLQFMAILTFLGLHPMWPLAMTIDWYRKPRPVLSLMPVAVTRRPGKQTLQNMFLLDFYNDLVYSLMFHYIYKHQIIDSISIYFMDITYIYIYVYSIYSVPQYPIAKTWAHLLVTSLCYKKTDHHKVISALCITGWWRAR